MACLASPAKHLPAKLFRKQMRRRKRRSNLTTPSAKRTSRFAWVHFGMNGIGTWLKKNVGEASRLILTTPSLTDISRWCYQTRDDTRKRSPRRNALVNLTRLIWYRAHSRDSFYC